MIRVGILGATGYTAFESIRRLLVHPQACVTIVTSRQDEGRRLDDVHHSLAGRTDLVLENADADRLADQADCVFCCLPHGASAEQVKGLLERGLRVVDFSADYRLRDLSTYESWYGVTHPDPDRVGSTVYGLPELFGDRIAGADLVANPGCFPTSAILALAPFVAEGTIEPDSIVVDSKTGVSGGGRTPKLSFHYPECNESISAYNVGRHRHMPEIDDILSRVSPRPVSCLFTPHLVPMDRGILSTIYARPVEAMDEARAMDLLRSYHAGHRFVQVVDHLPATKDVSGTNRCHVTARVVRGRLVLVSVIDNLIKGASGAAIQNLNRMYGLDEAAGLAD